MTDLLDPTSIAAVALVAAVVVAVLAYRWGGGLGLGAWLAGVVSLGLLTRRRRPLADPVEPELSEVHTRRVEVAAQVAAEHVKADQLMASADDEATELESANDATEVEAWLRAHAEAPRES